MKQYRIGEAKNGKLHVEPVHLIDGRYLVTYQPLRPLAEEQDYRAAYFAKITVLGNEIGYTKSEMHEEVKKAVLARMMEEIPEFFDSTNVSTTNLSDEAWVVFLQRFDLWSFTEHNVLT